jgi:integrase
MSSWRQRLARRNGFQLFPLAPDEPRHVDPDLSPSARTLAWLEKMSGASVDTLERLTLRGLDGSLLSFGLGRPTPRWVVPLHVSRRDCAFGAQFCPACLLEDAEPYFRLHWRLALMTWCPKHQVLLCEACPNCGHPGWPASAVLPKLYRSARGHELHCCPLCGFDLRGAATLPGQSHLQEYVCGQSLCSEIRLTETLSVSASEFATALWETCQLFVRTRPGALIAARASEQGELARGVGEFCVKSIEYLPVAARHATVDASAALFSKWPDTFVAFGSEHNLAAMHFSDSKEYLPGWFTEAIEAHLARQRRGITASDVASARTALLKQGKRITRSELGRVLGSRDAAAVVAGAPIRSHATKAEIRGFLEELDAYVREPLSRRSSSEVRVRNALVILIAMHTHMPPGEVLRLPEGEAREYLRRVAAAEGYGRGKVRTAFVNRWVSRYERTRASRSEKRPLGSDGLYFENFRGGPVSERTVQAALRRCMSGLDPSLRRTASVLRP